VRKVSDLGFPGDSFAVHRLREGDWGTVLLRGIGKKVSHFVARERRGGVEHSVGSEGRGESCLGKKRRGGEVRRGLKKKYANSYAIKEGVISGSRAREGKGLDQRIPRCAVARRSRRRKERFSIGGGDVAIYTFGKENRFGEKKKGSCFPRP